MKPIIAYYRVSTQKQARSGKKGLGLGLEASARHWNASRKRTGSRLSLNLPKSRQARERTRSTSTATGKRSQQGSETQMLGRGREARQAFRDVHFISGLIVHRVPFIVPS